MSSVCQSAFKYSTGYFGWPCCVRPKTEISRESDYFAKMRASGMTAPKRLIAALLLFGISFGYVEAAVVVYLRSMYKPLREHFYPDVPPDQPVPLLSIDQLRSAGPDHLQRVRIELGREIGTLVMLAAVALLAARNIEQWLAAFLIAFGAWDISFYAFLKAIIHWPQSLLTWDVLFLVPVPWIAPVLAPVLVSVSMIAAGVIILWRDERASALRLGLYDWAMLLASSLILVLAFTWDFRGAMAGKLPATFNWPLFALGEGAGAIVFIKALASWRSQQTAEAALSRE
jgi:hypothetical protein